MNLYNLANDKSIGNTIHNYRGFYIEGVLFDNGKAVCDGIAKTFSLMCGIENIECYKAIGLVDDGGSHAWNKVKVKVPNDTVARWYVVDATWSDVTPQGTTTEYLSHRYFLKTDAEMSKHLESLTDEYFSYLRSRHVDIPVYDLDRKNEGVEKATTSFNYYNKTYNGSINSYVESVDKLRELKIYVSANDLSYFEFKSTVTDRNGVYTLAGYECKSCSNAEVSNVYVYIKK